MRFLKFGRARAQILAPLVLAALSALFASACEESDKCAEERVALELQLLNIPSDLVISKVTIELEEELECGTFAGASGRVYTCWEQGGGTYTLRVYSGTEVVRSEEYEIPADGCHIKERVTTELDLSE